jgi:hypothetical protein
MPQSGQPQHSSCSCKYIMLIYPLNSTVITEVFDTDVVSSLCASEDLNGAA